MKQAPWTPEGSKPTRREFLRTGTTIGAAGLLGGSALAEEKATAATPAPAGKSVAEKLVRELHDSLSDHQRSRVVLPFDDPLRNRIENNWHILNEKVGAFFDTDQQQLVRDIFLNLHSDEYRDEVWKQFIGDNRTRNATTPEEIFGTSSIALFSDETFDNFEFVLTGRHTTRRCDGNSVKNAAFGGPIFYGHAAQGFNEKPDHPGNAYWFQAKTANSLFEMLDEKQQKLALKDESRGEKGTRTVALKGKAEGIEGLPSYEMSSDQRGELMKVVGDLLLPFREEDRSEALKMIEAQASDLHIAFYQNEDVGGDRVWDTWQIEGPSMVWYFRGDPHVHVWVNIKDPAAV